MSRWAPCDGRGAAAFGAWVAVEIGVSQFETPSSRAGELLRRCDLALYAAAATPQEERRTDLECARTIVNEMLSAAEGSRGSPPRRSP